MTSLIELNDDYSEAIRYDRPDYPIYVRRGTLSPYPNYAAPSHWHDDVELIAVRDGEMDYNVNGDITTLHPGQGIFVNSRQIHFGFSDSRTECEFICVILHPLLLCAVPAYEREFILPVIQGGTAFSLLDPETGWQRAVLEQIRSLDRARGRETSPLRALSAFSVIWSLLYENLPRSGGEAQPHSGDLAAARNMVGFIQKNYAGKISLREIALSGAVGQSKCCKLFAKYFSQTPNGYLNRYRLNKSLELLRDTGLSVTEIALAVGFGGGSYYAKAFRDCFGKSPTQYRKEAAIPPPPPAASAPRPLR